MIADIIVSQRANIENKDRIIVNPFILYRLPSFPAVYTFTVSLIINDINKNDFKQIELILTGEKNYKKELLSGNLPDVNHSQPNVAIDINIQNIDIPEPGKYTLILKVSGSELVTKNIYFKKIG